MANELMPIENSRGPLAMQTRRAQNLATNMNFSDGVRDAFPLLSIKGKVFRVRISGQETAFVDPATRQAIAALDIVLVNASRTLSKAYYIKGFTDGDLNPPDCWSMDSIRPDPAVANKVSLTCVNCPMNAFGSKVTDNGKAAKACQDARRIAVVMPHRLTEEGDPLVMMLRVPQSSLKNLKAYAQLLDRHGYEPNGCITRIQFDYQEAYPKLIFNFVGPLDDNQYVKVVELAESPTTASMLQAPDFETAPSTAPKQADTVGGMVPQTGPVLENPAVAAGRGAPVLEPVQKAGAGLASVLQETTGTTAAKLEVVPAGLIELPDGKLFNPLTGQYVERTQPAVQMAEPDPDTLTLPEGKFFNKRLNTYVTGPEKGAKAVGADTPTPTVRKRGPNKPKEPPATTAPASGNAQTTTPPPAHQTQAEASVDQQSKSVADMLVQGAVAGGAVHTQNSGDNPANGGGANPVVVAAPQNLESLLTALTGAKPQ